MKLPDDRTREFVDENEGNLFSLYAAIIRRLRAPDGCPWDRKQTLKTLRRFIVEESFEVLAAINDLENPEGTLEAVADELGDVLLVVMLLADALSLDGGPSFSDILIENGDKLLRRHPHVFSSVKVENESEVVTNWKEIKRTVENKNSGVAFVSAGLPPLERAYEIQKKAADQGFDWPDVAPVMEKIREEIAELETEIADSERQNVPLRDNLSIEAELGDLLFSVVNLARKLKTDPSVALAGTNERFLSRFSYIEEKLSDEGQDLASTNLEELDQLWTEAKKR